MDPRTARWFTFTWTACRGAHNFRTSARWKNIGQVTSDSHKMVLFKRGFAGTISEWLSATDYITSGSGTDNVVPCAPAHVRKRPRLHATSAVPVSRAYPVVDARIRGDRALAADPVEVTNRRRFCPTARSS